MIGIETVKQKQKTKFFSIVHEFMIKCKIAFKITRSWNNLKVLATFIINEIKFVIISIS